MQEVYFLIRIFLILGDTSDIIIPSTFISYRSYSSLLSLVSQVPSVRVTIITTSTVGIPLLDAIFLILLFLTLACTYIAVGFRSAHEYIRLRAPLSVIKALPHGRWTRENTIQQVRSGPTRNVYGYHFHPHRPMALECVICLENFVEGDIVISLPCDHDFHEVCM